MRNYDRINALPPGGINDKHAHIIGGGIAGLAAAAFTADTLSTLVNGAAGYNAS